LRSDDDTLQRRYHHLLQKAIIEWLGSIHRSTWQAEIHRVNITGSALTTYAGRKAEGIASVVLDVKDIERLLGGNMFSEIHTLSGDVPERLQIVLPPKTEVKVQIPRKLPQQQSEPEVLVGPYELLPNAHSPSHSQITIANPRVTIVIEVLDYGVLDGIGGYRQIENLSEGEAARFKRAVYMVTVSTQYNRWRLGDPEMPQYRSWATQIMHELRQVFDEQRLWKHNRELYMLENTGRAEQ
jgi:hypothetical protein